jgi:HEAT repeats
MGKIFGEAGALASQLRIILACENLPAREARGMKARLYLVLGLFCLGFALTMPAREAAPRYKFTVGETNAFAVEFTVRNESGSEVNTGKVFLVTKEVTTNSAKLVCRGTLKSEVKRTPPRGPGYFGGFFPGMTQNMNVFPNDCEIELDAQGREIRDGGDYVLDAPLGKLVQSLFAPLPAKSSEDASVTVTLLDDPFWLGPAESFLNVRMNGQPISMNYFYMNGQRNQLATLAANCQSATRQKNSTADALEFHRQVKLESFTQTAGEPRLTASTETDLVFDRKTGRLATIDTQGEAVSQTDAASRHAKVTFKAHLLTGAELAAATAPPPPPPPPHKLAGAELDKLAADLKSSEAETRRAAIRQLNGVEVVSPSPELVDLVAGQALDSDSFVRMTAANFLGTYATSNQVPVLIKLVKDSDWSVRQPALKALGRLKDERAIQPLVDLLARNGNSYGQDTTSALINFGPAAEKAVLGLLNERSADTLRQACNVLQQIGTGDSLEPLQKLVGDSDQQVSQAAVDAVRAIKQRQ